MKMLPWMEELYHHGILGQKWGRRNGPPYPLDYGRHSAAERKAGWQKSLNKGKGSSTPVAGGGGGGKKPDELTEEEKKMLEKFYKDLEEHLEWIKERHGDDVSPLEMMSSQNFGLTLAEMSGYELTDEQEEKFRKAAFDHYSKNSTQKKLHEANYAINEGALKLDQVSRDSKVLYEPEKINSKSNELVIKDGKVYERTVNNGVTIDTPVNADSDAKKVIDNNTTLEVKQDSTETKDLINKAKKWINDHLSGTVSYENKDD